MNHYDRGELMKKALILGGLATALVLAGCGSSDDGADAAPAAATGASASAAAGTKTPAAPAWITSAVGEGHGVACEKPGDGATCDIAFNVTAITPNVECVNDYVLPASEQLGDDQKTLRVEVDAESLDSYKVPSSEGALLSSNWAVRTADGYTVSDLDVAVGCTDMISPEFLYKVMPVGTKARASIVFRVPADADTLVLGLRNGRGGWTWPIPA